MFFISLCNEIGERYLQILITTWKTPRLYNFTTHMFNFPVTFAYLIGDGRFFQRNVTFWLLRLINTLIYLLTAAFLVDKHLWQLYK